MGRLSVTRTCRNRAIRLAVMDVSVLAVGVGLTAFLFN